MHTMPLFKAVIEAGQPLVVRDTATSALLDEELRGLCIGMQIISFINVPLIKQGKPVGALCLTQGQPRAWTELEVALVQETAERTWAAVEQARAQATIRESEARFRLMVDSVPLSIWITDAKGRVEYLNQHWCDYCGVRFDPTTADGIAARLLHSEDGPKVMTRFRQAMEKGIAWEVEKRNRSAGGQYRWFLNLAQPYRDPATGQIIKWLG